LKPISIRDILLYEDEHLLIFNKPPFVSSLDERQGTAASILSIARQYCSTVQLCHRLDKETSGILVAAKDPETYREVSIEFEKRRVRKIYNAVVGGIHRFEELEVDLPIGPAKNRTGWSWISPHLIVGWQRGPEEVALACPETRSAHHARSLGTSRGGQRAVACVD
jgi:23S rRNA-/tRNA-specific pseudouridylate synthase